MDNLYCEPSFTPIRDVVVWLKPVSVDMNGIVHPCTHPEGRPAPETEEEMMAEVFRYTERVVNMARPRKVLMMAIGKQHYLIPLAVPSALG